MFAMGLNCSSVSSCQLQFSLLQGCKSSILAHFPHGNLGIPPIKVSAPLECHCVAQVVPALGAEEIVAFCGSVRALLAALVVDLRDAFLPEACLNMQG